METPYDHEAEDDQEDAVILFFPIRPGYDAFFCEVCRRPAPCPYHED